MTKTSRLLLAAAVSAGLLGGQAFAGATPNHLKCYKAKEISGPGKFEYTASLQSGTIPPLNDELGCTIKGPSKLVCAPVGKFNISPPPPGGGPTAPTTKFVCYKVKCPKGPEQSLTAIDQFGTHTFTLKKPKVVCAPASPSGAFLDDASGF